MWSISEHIVPVGSAFDWSIVVEREIQPIGIGKDPGNLSGQPITGVVVVECDDHRAVPRQPPDLVPEEGGLFVIEFAGNTHEV